MRAGGARSCGRRAVGRGERQAPARTLRHKLGGWEERTRVAEPALEGTSAAWLRHRSTQ